MRGLTWSAVLHACAIGGLFVAAGIDFSDAATPPAASVEVVLLPPSVAPRMPVPEPPALRTEFARELPDNTSEYRTERVEAFVPDRPIRSPQVPPPSRRLPLDRRIEPTVVPPVAGHNPPPKYPKSAVMRGLVGRVEIEVVVSAAGEPTSVKIRTRSGHRVLDEAAASAIWSWRFTPATRGGEPIEYTLTRWFRFRLTD